VTDSSSGFEYDYSNSDTVVYVTHYSEGSAVSAEFMSDVAFASLDSFAKAVISEITDEGFVYSSNDLLPFAKKCFAAADSYSSSAIVGGQEGVADPSLAEVPLKDRHDVRPVNRPARKQRHREGGRVGDAGQN
jgi:hypothetical protein